MLLLLSHDISQHKCKISQVSLTSCPTVSSASIHGRIAKSKLVTYFFKSNMCGSGFNVIFVVDLCNQIGTIHVS